MQGSPAAAARAISTAKMKAQVSAWRTGYLGSTPDCRQEYHLHQRCGEKPSLEVTGMSDKQKHELFGTQVVRLQSPAINSLLARFVDPCCCLMRTRSPLSCICDFLNRRCRATLINPVFARKKSFVHMTEPLTSCSGRYGLIAIAVRVPHPSDSCCQSTSA